MPVSSADAAGARRSDLAGGPPPVVPADEPPQRKSVVFSWNAPGCRELGRSRIQKECISTG